MKQRLVKFWDGLHYQTQIDIFVVGSCLVTGIAGVLVAWLGH